MSDLSVHYSSASPKWNTPKPLVAKVVEVLKWIDLDPCSDSLDNPNVPAKVCYDGTLVDGLTAEWHGKVYMNPPYGRIIPKWTRKAVAEWQFGRMQEAILLVPARTDTRWFRELWIGTICFWHGRMKFEQNGKGLAPAPFPSALVYFGYDDTEFRRVFRPYGTIVRRME